MTGRVLLTVVMAVLAIGSYSQNSNANSAALEAAQKVAAFKAWKAENSNIGIDVREEEYRMLVFNDNTGKISKHNAGKSAYKMKMNQLGIWTQAEYKEKLLTFTPGPVGSVALPLREIKRNLQIQPVTPEKNWTANGGTTAVRNQGQCGSCYAFATLAGAESAILIDYKIAVDLSEQQIVDCTTDHNLGCDGGSVYWSLVYANTNGIVTQSTYPYNAKDTTMGNTCRFNSGPYLLWGVRYADGEVDMRFELQFRPYPVYVDADDSGWQFYSSGVLDSCGSSINHGVLLVGYTLENNWIIKNSWGTGWGQRGYVTLKSGNTCGILNGYRYYLSWY